MSQIDQIHQGFTQNLERTMQISGLYDLVINIAISSIKSLGQVRSRLGGDAAKNQIDVLSNLKGTGQIKELLPIVSGQQVVLFVSAFETYLKEIAKFIGNNHINLIAWPDKASGKIDLTVLSSSVVTIGDLVLAILDQHNISFQDLQATKRFFADYLGIDLEIDTQFEEDIILAAAIRHSVIHSNGIVDEKFLRQIRNLDKTTKSRYVLGRPIELTEEDVVGFRDSFINFSDSVKTKLAQKIADTV